MSNPIRVAILEDHQSIIDGYLFRLSNNPEIVIVATAHYGNELEPMLAKHSIDVLLLDINVPNSAEDHNLYPIMNAISHMLMQYKRLSILVISMLTQPSLIDAIPQRSRRASRRDSPGAGSIARGWPLRTKRTVMPR